jgi:flagellar basal body-associated protein FliL
MVMVVTMRMVTVVMVALAVIVIAIGVVMTMVVRAVIVIVFLQEIRINLELVIQIEAAQIEDLLDVGFPEIHGGDRRTRVHVQQAVLERVNRLGIDQIGLRDEQPIGKADLALHDFVRVKLLIGVFRINQGDHGIEQEVLGHFVVHEERLGDRARIREAGGFNDHAVKLNRLGFAAFCEIGQRHHEVAANRAADTAVAHLNDLLGGILHEDFVVDVFFAEFIFDDGDFHAVRIIENTLEQGGFAAAEESGQDGDGNLAHDVRPKSKKKTVN